MFKFLTRMASTRVNRSLDFLAPRRSVSLAVFLVIALFAQGIAVRPDVGTTDAASNPIQIENSNAGDPTWDDFASVAQQDAISGYASPISVNHGSPVDFYVTTTASSFTITVYRMGWYGGAGARKMASLGTFTGVHQAIPSPDPITGMVSCNWQKTTTLTIPASWTTGVYLAKLAATSGNKSFIFFNVRNDGGTEDIMFQSSVTTYQAYNAYGGVSLYTNNTNNSVYKYAAATKVSFDRPFDPLDSNGSGHFLAYEYPFIRWAEKQGYNLTYATDVDTNTNVNPITNHKAFLSVGHDEYWSKGMRNNVQNAINAGVNVAFFSANTDYWQIRFEPNAAGVPNRVEVGYKDSATSASPPGPDPQWNVNNAIVTTRWRDNPVSLPENALIGVMYQDQVNRDYSYVVQNAANWIYAGTGFTDGSSVPGIVGYEYDKVWNNGFSPPGLTVLSNSPVVGCCEGSGSSHANSTLYTAASGARVFAAGTIQWSWGLDNYSADGNYANAGIQKTTANILANFIGGPPASAPAVTLSSTSLSFTSQQLNTTSSAQTVTLTNSGNALLTISGVAMTGTNSGDFSQSNTCPISPSTLAAGSNCTINVTFTPSATGTRSASVSVTDNAGGSPHTVSVSGTGASPPAPAVSLNPTSLTFSSQQLNTTSGAQTVTLTNSSNAALTITSIALTGNNPGDFSQTSACPLSPSTLAAGANCAISVTFTPTATGTRSASVSVADNAGGSPHTVSVSGTGASSPAPLVSFNPTSLTFTSQQVNTTSGAQTVTLTNSGNAALTITSVNLTGTNAGDFSQTNACPLSPSTLAAGANCAISVTFTPIATGTRSASVSVTDNASGSPHNVSLTGTGTLPAPTVSISPKSLTFTSQQLNTTSSAQAVTLTNSGNAPLTISGIAMTGTNSGDFSQSNTCPISPGTLASGSNCTINVTFTPSATGTRSASVSVTDNAGGSPHTVSVSGTGASPPAPAVSLNPTSLTFSSQQLNTTSGAQTVTLTNSSNAALTITSIALTGTNPGDFSQTSACPLSPSTLAAGANCTIGVTFTPTATGTRSASVSVADNAGGSPHSVSLSGTGSSAVLFSDGFESASLPGFWTSTSVSTNNSLTLDASLRHSGNASLKAVTVKGSAGNSYVSKSIAGQTALDVRGYYYLSNPVNWGAVQVMSLYAQGNFLGWVSYNVDPSTPTLTVYDGANNVLYSCSTVPTLNAWHSIELQYVLSTTAAGSFTLWLDGIQVCGKTAIVTSGQAGLTIDQVLVGVDTADDTVGLTVHVDDVIVSKNFIGP